MKTGIDKRVDVLSATTNRLEFCWTSSLSIYNYLNYNTEG